MAFLGQGRRHRHRPKVPWPHLRDLPAPAFKRKVSRCGHGTGRLQKSGGLAGWKDLVRIGTWHRVHLLFHHPQIRQGGGVSQAMLTLPKNNPMVMEELKVLILEDN